MTESTNNVILASVSSSSIELKSKVKHIAIGSWIAFVSNLPLKCVVVKPPDASEHVFQHAFQFQKKGTYNFQAILSDGKTMTRGVSLVVGIEMTNIFQQQDKKASTITSEAAISVLLAAASMAVQGSEQKLSLSQRIGIELSKIFTNLDSGLIAAMIESRDGSFSLDVYKQLSEQNGAENKDSKSTADPKGTKTKDMKENNSTSSKGEEEKKGNGEESEAEKPKEKAEGGQQKNGEGQKKKKKKKKKKDKQDPSTIALPNVITVGKNMMLDGCTSISTGKVLGIVPLREVKDIAVEVVLPSNRVKESLCTFVPEEYGLHTLRVMCDKKSSEDFYFVATSPVFEYCSALDRLYDQLFWSWEGKWHEEIEHSLLQLVIEIEDNLKKFLNSMEQTLSSFGHGSDTKMMITNLQDNMGDAMTNHDKTAVGRLHQSVYQFLEMGILPLPASFREALAHFERVKFKHSNQAKVKSSLLEVQRALARHATQAAKDMGQQDHYVTTLLNTQKMLDSMLAQNKINLSLMWELRPKPLMSLFASLQGVKIVNARSKVNYLPSLTLEEVIAGGKALDEKVSLYGESLLGDALMVQSLLGYSVGKNIAQDRKMIMNLLHAGFGYLTSRGGKIIPTLNSVRAVLPLPDMNKVEGKGKKSLRGEVSPRAKKGKNNTKFKGWHPGLRKLKKRAKDVARTVRNLPRPNGKLSIRVNTEFKETIKLLREHHKDSWVGESIEKVWEAMWKDGDMITFELWYGNELIGADLAHCVGNSFYVATRFFKKEYRKFQPGFLLALVETKLLANAGFSLWDLGGTDSSPMMAYKKDVSIEMSRPEFLSRFRPARSGKGILKTGELIEDIKLEHLLLS
eukprot:CAMPEP_0167754148 /NCGR_PEP_ID=MMETSP0110_2-20121227/8108_1 /TAXON_ID=629695 /ORGANISM="Gymnochlora sp., Strain CCMP2014" /LENGTH=852 /DNA_ID=CAMNT_0007639993 /DNA_START=72 /DNA_END=2631 /DNA_ORIENTATION=+